MQNRKHADRHLMKNVPASSAERCLPATGAGYARTRVAENDEDNMAIRSDGE